MNTTERADLRRLAEAATTGPWLYSYHGMFNPPGVRVKGREHDMCTVTSSDRDADFIAAANPQVVLALLNRLEQLERVAEAAKGLYQIPVYPKHDAIMRKFFDTLEVLDVDD